MHSILKRLRCVIRYALIVLACLMVLCFLSSFLVNYRTRALMKTVKVFVESIQDSDDPRKRNVLGSLTFDLNIDLSYIFNWNVDKVYIYLTAAFTAKNEYNEELLWDKYILSKKEAKIQYSNIIANSFLWYTNGYGLKGVRNITLSVRWNIIPNAGLVRYSLVIGRHSFRFPLDYATAKINLSFSLYVLFYSR